MKMGRPLPSHFIVIFEFLSDLFLLNLFPFLCNHFQYFYLIISLAVPHHRYESNLV